MKPIFTDNAAWKAFLPILESWEGTPYRHLQMVKGRGADCTLFIAAAAKEAGYLERVEYDYYPRDWHLHTKDERVLDGLVRHAMQHLAPGVALKEMTQDVAPMRGDIITFSRLKSGITHHACIYLGSGAMMHSLGRVGVRKAQARNWRQFTTGVFRLMRKEA